MRTPTSAGGRGRRHARLARGLAGGAAALAVGLSLAAGSATAASIGPNLVVNGDAETAVGGEWSTPTPPARATHGAGGYPASDIIGGGTFAGGTALFYGGNTASMVTEQTIVLGPADLSAVAGGSATSLLSAFIGGYAGQGDHLGLEAEWRNASGDAVLTQVLDPVTNVERRGRSGFLPRGDTQPIPAAATQVVIRLTGTRTSGTANDGYIDNIDLRLVTGLFPQLSKAFSPPARPVGGISRLTLTVTSRDAVNDDNGWTFTDDLPVGLRIAATPNAATTCAGTGPGAAAEVSATAGGETVGVTGDVAAGTACTVAVDVTSSTTGSYANGRDNVGAIRIERPTADATVSFHDPPAVSLTGPAAATELTVGATSAIDFGCTGTATPLTCTATVEGPGGTTVTIADGADLPTAAPGVYTVTAKVVDAAGQEQTVTRTYEVLAPPTATIEPVPDRLTIDQPVPGSFACDAPAGLASCTTTVELPDGSTVPLLDGGDLPTTVPGVYTITTTAVDDLGGTTSVTRSYEVVSRPTTELVPPARDAALLSFVVTDPGAGPEACVISVQVDGVWRELPTTIVGDAASGFRCEAAPGALPAGDHPVRARYADALGQTSEGVGRLTVSSPRVEPSVPPVGELLPPTVLPLPAPRLLPPAPAPVGEGRLRVTKQVVRPRLRPGQSTVVRLTIANRGTATLHDVRVCERVPAGLRFVSATPRATLSRGQRCWTVATLRPGQSLTRSYVARALNRPGTAVLRTSGTANGADSVAASRSIRIRQAPSRAGGVVG